VTGQVRALARGIWKRPVSHATYPVCAHRFTRQNMTHSTAFPNPEGALRQPATAISWYIWKVAILRVPLSTLHRQTKSGGLGLIDIAAKCRTLSNKIKGAGEKDTLTTARLRIWDRRVPKDNPPNIRRYHKHSTAYACICSNWRIWHPGEKTIRIEHLQDGYTELCEKCTRQNAHHGRYV
jgi:hypothetical protein